MDLKTQTAYHLPKVYFYSQKILENNGKITPRVLSGLENVLSAYSMFIPAYACAHDNNPKNFQISKVYIVGSAVREHRIDSDLDLMLIAPQIDEVAERNIKVWMSVLFFNNKPKNQAIDVFVRQHDRFPERPSYDITNQVKKLLRQYNNRLAKK